MDISPEGVYSPQRKAWPLPGSTAFGAAPHWKSSSEPSPQNSPGSASSGYFPSPGSSPPASSPAMARAGSSPAMAPFSLHDYPWAVDWDSPAAEQSTRKNSMCSQVTVTLNASAAPSHGPSSRVFQGLAKPTPIPDSSQCRQSNGSLDSTYGGLLAEYGGLLAEYGDEGPERWQSEKRLSKTSEAAPLDNRLSITALADDCQIAQMNLQASLVRACRIPSTSRTKPPEVAIQAAGNSQEESDAPSVQQLASICADLKFKRRPSQIRVRKDHWRTEKRHEREKKPVRQSDRILNEIPESERLPRTRTPDKIEESPYSCSSTQMGTSLASSHADGTLIMDVKKTKAEEGDFSKIKASHDPSGSNGITTPDCAKESSSKMAQKSAEEAPVKSSEDDNASLDIGQELIREEKIRQEAENKALRKIFEERKEFYEKNKRRQKKHQKKMMEKAQVRDISSPSPLEQASYEPLPNNTILKDVPNSQRDSQSPINSMQSQSCQPQSSQPQSSQPQSCQPQSCQPQSSQPQSSQPQSSQPQSSQPQSSQSQSCFHDTQYHYYEEQYPSPVPFQTRCPRESQDYRAQYLQGLQYPYAADPHNVDHPHESSSRQHNQGMQQHALYHNHVQGININNDFVIGTANTIQTGSPHRDVDIQHQETPGFHASPETQNQTPASDTDILQAQQNALRYVRAAERDRQRVLNYPRGEPPKDEYSVIDEDIPPYQAQLHRYLDLMAYDERFSPVLRVNKYLIHGDGELADAIAKFTQFNLIPTDLWSVSHVDERDYERLIPELIPSEPPASPFH